MHVCVDMCIVFEYRKKKIMKIREREREILNESETTFARKSFAVK